MKFQIIAEIGLNHLGKKKNLFEYLPKLKKAGINSITIQQVEHKYSFPRDIVIEFFNRAKKNFKYVGVSTSRLESLIRLKGIKFDFIKILSSGFQDRQLISYALKSNLGMVFLSTGLSSFENIKKEIKYHNNKKLSLIYTTFDKNIFNLNLYKIDLMKKTFKIKIAYGSHSHNLNTIPLSLAYTPDNIFFYVKLDKKLSYPDNKHAVPMERLKEIMYKIKFNKKIFYNGKI